MHFLAPLDPPDAYFLSRPVTSRWGSGGQGTATPSLAHGRKGEILAAMRGSRPLVLARPVTRGQRRRRKSRDSHSSRRAHRLRQVTVDMQPS